ncbi:IclR family transcriptional regulator [Amycolatopsis sp. H20-H5]|uniref:IclR family transcriptional regulator n=1 Tax=Amycolatopsis sp. H20-H5 TaxID=3046309 RepID=UPI002DB895FB|nr:IclR family transcriptional regulator [Amycolatopsis sp. H20-H5]MEC3980090.1 IclR family transcriptional regulator [Amycolatopsis sp. H20-H5]
MDEGRADGSSVQVVRKSARILDCFSAITPRLRAADIVHATALPASTVARILRTLVGENLLQRQGQEYSIGLRVTVWSAAAKAGSDLIAAAGPHVTALRDSCRESCGVYVRQGASRVSVLGVESTHSIIYRGYIGQILPLQAGAAGKVFMAYDEHALQAALEDGLLAHTSHTVTDPQVLEKQLDQVREQGWAFAEQEREPGLNSLGAPIFGPGETIVAAIAVGAPSFRLTRAAAEDLADEVTACAAAISEALLGQRRR